MIVVTGAAGFIGSHMALLAEKKDNHLILVDDEAAFDKRKYTPSVVNHRHTRIIETDMFLDELSKLPPIDLIIHMGAITNTAEKNVKALEKYNTDYTKRLWAFCTEKRIPFLYASSAATYGDGGLGFSDDHSKISKLKPLNPYGQSKHLFDLFALDQKKTPNGWWGMKFFNVFGPHEDHKDRMASTVWHGYHEISGTGKMTLFKSHNPGFKDGAQRRDFVFIADVINMADFILSQRPESGIYNIGTGQARTYFEVAEGLFSALDKPVDIKWIDTPEQFRSGYQYHTQAEMTKLISQGFNQPMTPLKTAIATYVREYLVKH